MPYTRPPLSKEFLTSPDLTDVSAHTFPALPDADWRLGRRAAELDLGARRVRLSGGEAVPYDRLIIATGSRPRRWDGPGAELAGLHSVRAAEDAVALRKALLPGSRLAILGAGFIGCEVAASARALGVEVTLIDLSPQPMPVLGPELGEMCAGLHRGHGVDLRLGQAVAALHGIGGQVCAVELTDGSRIATDVVLVALGAVPCTQWLLGSGLTVDPGVRCDGTLTATGDPDVLAAGDVAECPHRLTNYEFLRVEHWTNAAEQGLLAGRNATLPPAERRALDTVPSFWSDQYGIKIQALGLPRLAQRLHLVERSEDRTRLVAVGERNGLLVAVIAFNGTRRLPWYRRRLGAPLDLRGMRRAIAADSAALGLVGPAPESDLLETMNERAT
jgi:NADPH-dependent 2,4-dienoyl-CoA reductase/sulfur reductase-like enzyme